jgi:hypothetical protein
MHILTPEEARFLLHRSVQKLPASVLKDLRGSDAARTRAIEAAVDIMLGHFAAAGHQVVRPPPRPGMDFGKMGNG